MKIGIYGGTFNPPHLGHLAAARAAIHALGLEQLIWIPAHTPPHKELPEQSATARQRLDMTRLAADQLHLPKVAQVWDVELNRKGKSYTADTLRQARARWPEAELWLLMGTDMFLTLQHWHQPEDVLSMAGICAFGRTEKDSEEIFAAQRDFLSRTYPGCRLTTISIPNLVDISSTRLRELLARGEGQEYLPRAVYGFILREHLYGTNVDLRRLSMEELRCVSYSMVQAKRLPHIRGTEEEAARLALRWGSDPQQMRRAAILHDCTKYLTLEEHLAICRHYGVVLDELEQVTEKLLHAKTGAALARHMFGEDDKVVEAICYHTTGRKGMSLEEKILYMADYMEPCRRFPEVEEMRRLAYEDLDRGVAMGAGMVIRDMVAAGRPIHPNTQSAWETYRAED